MIDEFKREDAIKEDGLVNKGRDDGMQIERSNSSAIIKK